MAKSKATKASTPQPTAEPDAEVNDVLDELESEVGATTLATAQKAFLQKASRFLVNVQSPRYVARARRQGYGKEEHKQGWTYWSVASGMTRSLDHWFTEQGHAVQEGEAGGERLRLLQEIDAFENTWFPRVRMIIRRHVPRESREAFAAAFFKDLAQQPLGPGVVGSVTGLLNRVAELEKSAEPGAKQVWTTLRKRGFTATKIAQVRALLKEVEEGAPAAPREATVSPKTLAEAQAAQLEAFEDLRDWFNDWATMLRDVFGVADQVFLGLTSARGGRGGVDEVLEEDAAEEGTDAAAPVKPNGKPA